MKETQRTKGESPYGSLPTSYVRLSTATTTLQKVNHLRKKLHRRKIKELVDGGRGCVFGPPPPMSFSSQLRFASAVLVYLSVNVHEIILNDFIDRRLDGPVVFLI